MSDNLDESAEEGTSPAKKKRKLTKAAEAKLKAKEKAALQKKTGKKVEDEEEDEEEDPYKAKSKGLMSSAATGKAPPIGTFHECAQCQKKFTVVRNLVPAFLPAFDNHARPSIQFQMARASFAILVQRLWEKILSRRLLPVKGRQRSE